MAEWAQAHPEEPVVDRTDDRIWGAVPMAPAGHEVLVGGLAGSTTPTLVLGGADDTITSMEEQVGPIYDALGMSPRHLGELEGATHFTFSNACDLFPTYDDCEDEGHIDNVDAHPLINTVATAFLLDLLGDEHAGNWLPPESASWTWTEE